MFIKIIIFCFLILDFCITGTLRDFGVCHDDFGLKPTDGILKPHSFTWLAFVQYIHVTTGLPHHSKAPRVVMVQRQFVLGTATDLLHLPKNYKLGNVIFGDYEREEDDCGLTKSQLNLGARCSPAYLEVPIEGITPHPEFTRFGVGNSLALVKLIRPLKSNYMIPICLPSLGQRKKLRVKMFVFMIDYITLVPRDFDTERMGKKTLKLYTQKECKRHRMLSKLGNEGVSHALCSSGCGVRAGAPIITHAVTGVFQLVGLAAGGAPCSRKSMRGRMNTEPPIYIDVYPYITWIINVVSAHVLPQPYPQNYKLTDTGSSVYFPGGPIVIRSGSDDGILEKSRELFKYYMHTYSDLGMGINRVGYLRKRKKMSAGWKARTFVSGNWCYKPAKLRSSHLVYAETFEINADPPAKINIYMKVSTGIECTIQCARLLMPNRLVTPIIDGVGGYNISLELNTEWFPYTYYLSLGLYGNSTKQSDMEEWLYERKPGFF